MFKRAIKKDKSKEMQLKGPYSMFISKILHPKDSETTELLKKHFEVAYEIQNEWLQFIRKKNGKDKKESEQNDMEEAKTAVLSNDKFKTKHDVTDSILNYFLFKNLEAKQKQQYVDLYMNTYDLKITDEFHKQYLKVKRNEKFRKTAFILWMNHYLREKTSIELLELDTLDLVLKMGEIWNNLPISEQCKWESLRENSREFRKEEEEE